MKKYVCGICEKGYEDLEEYLKCVSSCGETLKANKKKEEEKKRLEEINAALNRIKQAKAYYEEQLDKFKEKYPEEYELNFGKAECVCPSDCKGFEENTKSETIELSYKDDGKGKPKMKAKINGKDIGTDTLDKLFDDPETKYIAKLLGIL